MRFKNSSNSLGFSKAINSRIEIYGRYRIKGGISSRKVSVKELSDSIDRALIRAITELRDEVDKNLKLAIVSRVWNTRNGLDDIYSSGKLLRSGEVRVVNGSSGIDISYDEPYAGLIYYGGYITPYGSSSQQKVYIPPRPWIAAVLNGENGLPSIKYQEIIYDALRQELR